MDGLKGLHQVRQKKWSGLALSSIYFSITTSVPIHPPLYSDPNKRPAGVSGLGPRPRLLSFSLPSLAAPWEHPYKPALVCVSLMNSLKLFYGKKADGTLGRFTAQTEKMKEGRGAVMFFFLESMKCTLKTFLRPAQNMPRTCTFFQFISYWIKVSDCWTPFRRIWQRKKRKTEDVSEEGLNLEWRILQRRLCCEDDGSYRKGDDDDDDYDEDVGSKDHSMQPCWDFI